MEANGFPQFKQIDYLPTATGFRQGPGKKNAYIYIYIKIYIIPCTSTAIQPDHIIHIDTVIR